MTIFSSHLPRTPVVSPIEDIMLCLTQTTLKELGKNAGQDLNESLDHFEDARESQLADGPSTPEEQPQQQRTPKGKSVPKFKLEGTPRTGTKGRRAQEPTEGFEEGSTVKYAQITPSKKMR